MIDGCALISITFPTPSAAGFNQKATTPENPHDGWAMCRPANEDGKVLDS